MVEEIVMGMIPNVKQLDQEDEATEEVELSTTMTLHEKANHLPRAMKTLEDREKYTAAIRRAI